MTLLVLYHIHTRTFILYNISCRLYEMNVYISLSMHFTLFCRRLEVQKVNRIVPIPVATKRRVDTAHSTGTKLPIVKRSRPPVATSSDKQLQQTSLPQTSGRGGLPGNSGTVVCKVE
jgi:hypothetical protein